MYMYNSIYVCIYIYIYIHMETIISSTGISAAPQPVSVLFSGGWGLPTPGCLRTALPNMEEALRPTGVRQWEFWS